MEILHVAIAGRAQIDEHRRRRADLVQQIEVEPQPDAAGNGRQMDDGVGRAADRLKHAHRVLERRPRQDAIGREALFGEAHGAASRRLAVAQTIGVDGRHRRATGQHHAERLGHARHRARRAHHPAGPGRRDELRARLVHVGPIDLAAPEPAPDAPAVGARADARALDAPGEHRTGDDARWPGRSALAAPMSSAGTVLSQPPISTTASSGWARSITSTSIAMRLRANIAVGDVNISPSEMTGKLERQPAGLPDAALDGLGQLTQSAMAVVQLGEGIDDPDDGTVERLAREAHRLGHRSPQEQRELAVAVLDEAGSEPGLRHSSLLPAERRAEAVSSADACAPPAQ